MTDTVNFLKKQMGILVPITILLIFIVGMFKLEFSKQESLEKIEKEKQTMSEEELILFEASQARCTKRTGSRPSCWQKKDWDIFFLEYCKRVSCQK
ncbi:MAG: hypothetical protein ACO2ZP_03495 [Bacteriovoracaceae bacterium]